MNVDKRIIEPFNAWWRTKNHCEPSLAAIEAFDAGYKAALETVRRIQRQTDSQASGEAAK